MNHIQFETNGLTVLAVKVPETAISIKLNPHPMNHSGLWLWYKINTNITGFPLPKSHWKILCTTDTEITDEQLEAILPTTHKYRRFSHLMEILRSHGIDPNEKYVLLIKEK